ncbi:unnamed protein product [Closterium sp. NIES-53]
MIPAIQRETLCVPRGCSRVSRNEQGTATPRECPSRRLAEQVGGMAEHVGDMAEQVGDMAEQVGDMVEQIGDMAEQIGDMAEQIGDMAEQIRDKAEQVRDKVEQVRDKVEQVRDMAEQVGDMAEQVETMQPPPFVGLLAARSESPLSLWLSSISLFRRAGRKLFYDGGRRKVRRVGEMVADKM